MVRNVKETGLKTDAKGQMEIENIDTPLGEACEAFIQAEVEVKSAQASRDLAATNVIEEMRKVKIRTCRFKGNVIRYQPGHQTPDKVKFVPGN